MSKQVIALPEGALERKTRRALIMGSVAAIAGTAGYRWMSRHPDDTGIPALERYAMNVNGHLSHGYLSDAHLMPSYPKSQVEYIKPNGDIGLDSPIDSNWELNVVTNAAPAISLKLRDVQALPRIEMITRFCCIEGWSRITQWTGVRFADFTRKYFPPGRRLPAFVKMSTPDEEYYVGLDMKSAVHPQTLLAWELNGAPLTPEHGAPLRLVIPVKYGIKNIKRIGSIEYTDTRPGDYWAEEGYDWFAGL